MSGIDGSNGENHDAGIDSFHDGGGFCAFRAHLGRADSITLGFRGDPERADLDFDASMVDPNGHHNWQHAFVVTSSNPDVRFELFGAEVDGVRYPRLRVWNAGADVSEARMHVQRLG